jgi:hypothetical protein
MKITRQYQKTVEVKVDVICNRCGQSCYRDGFGPLGVEALATGQYESELLEDCHMYQFDLCEKCTVEVASTFKIPPTVYYAGLDYESLQPPEVPWETVLDRLKK